MAFVPYANAQIASDAIAATLFYMVGYAFTSFAAWAFSTSSSRSRARSAMIETTRQTATTAPKLATINMAGRVLPASPEAS